MPANGILALWALITLFWIVGGGFLGAIMGLDKLERSLYSYVEGVRGGEALFIIEVTANQAPAGVQILRRELGAAIYELQDEKERK